MSSGRRTASCKSSRGPPSSPSLAHGRDAQPGLSPVPEQPTGHKVASAPREAVLRNWTQVSKSEIRGNLHHPRSIVSVPAPPHSALFQNKSFQGEESQSPGHQKLQGLRTLDFEASPSPLASSIRPWYLLYNLGVK